MRRVSDDPRYATVKALVADGREAEAQALEIEISRDVREAAE